MLLLPSRAVGLFLVLTAAFIPGETSDGANFSQGVSRYLKEVLENLKNHMASGIPELKLPPLDPYSFDEDINVNVGDKGQLYFKNLRVFGLKTLKIRNIKAELFSMMAEISLQIGTVRGEGQYFANLLFSRIFPVKGQGNIIVQLDNVFLKAQIRLKLVEFTRLEATHLEFRLEVGGTTFDLENIINPQLAPVINRILSGFTPVIANAVLPKMQDKLKPKLLKQINRDLEKFDVAKLLDKLT